MFALPLSLLLPFQPIIAWWPYDKRVVLYYPWIFLGSLATALGIIAYFWSEQVPRIVTPSPSPPR